MPDYNPHSPQILGQEFVAIRDEDITFDPFADTYERGFGFTTTTTQTVDNAHVYLNTFPGKFFYNDCLTVGIYPRGTEDRSGPVRRVIIPCNNAIVTGDNGGLGLSAVAFGGGATTGQDAVWNPSGLQYLDIRVGELYRSRSSFFFDVNRYSNLLSGKRILGVNFLTTLDVGSTISNGGNDQGFLSQGIGNGASIIGTGKTVFYKPLATPQTPSTTLEFVRTRLGDVNPFFGIAGFTSLATNFAGDVSQWTYPELQRFEFSAANALNYCIFVGPVGVQSGSTNYIVSYAALEVFFCEEARIGYGTKIINFDFSTTTTIPYKYGANVVRLRNTSGTGLILPPGNYSVTFSGSNMGENYLTLQDPGNNPLFNELRALREFPGVPGIQVNLPYPLDDAALGTTLTSEFTLLIPQMSLHASGAVGTTLVDPHGYGRLARGQVWGTITATQNVNDSVTRFGGARPWPQVRYYARRFGETTVPLRLDCLTPAVSGTGTFVQITPTDFDALDEIVDGWKEVTLSFTTAPNMGTGTSATWRWSAISEQSGNRWEVLGVTAPAVSGQQTWLNLDTAFAPTAQQLQTTTYDSGASGSTFRESWMPWNGPYQSATTADTTADAVLIFSQTLPAVTGFSGATLTQQLATFEDCGNEACCVPTALLYNRLTWGLQPNTGIAQDSFTRVVANGLGSPDLGGGGAYVLNGTNTQFAVDGTRAVITPNASGTDLMGTLLIGPDFDVTCDLSMRDALLTGTSRIGLVGRLTDANNFYYAELDYTAPNGPTTLFVSKKVGGVFSDLGPSTGFALSSSVNAGGTIRMRFVGYGSKIMVKVWPPQTTTEPVSWDFVTTDTSLTTGTRAGLYAGMLTAAGGVMTYDNLTITPPGFWFGSYELQRMDSLTDWKTIMLATSPAVTAFNDYEARVDLTSSYRIRMNNALNFPGTWSTTVLNTIASPGVSGGPCLSSGHVMIFTTNERQDGSANLAYANAFDGQVVEDFSFPEAGFTQYQAMYNRDFFTAFRPTERGGEQFSRSILVSAAAISPETLANFVDLRDLAWDTVPYVCVRDEDGNRWFANITVPSGNVRNKRKLYIADVQVTEVTDTPSPVDP